MRTVFSISRYVILIAVIALLIATVAVIFFGLISTVIIVVESYSHGHFGAEGARELSVELIEMIDLFLLGTILFITAAGLQELFVDPGLGEIIPEWMSVSNIEQLKFNLLVVVVVMLSVLFLGVVASYELTEGAGIFDFGVAIAAVVLAVGITIYLFARVHREGHEGHEEHPAEAAEELAESGSLP